MANRKSGKTRTPPTTRRRGKTAGSGRARRSRAADKRTGSPAGTPGAGGGSESASNHPAADAAERRRAGRIYNTLARTYPDARCALNHRNPFELLVATILSAQCTDVRVNQVTPELFAAYPDAASLAQASRPDVEKMIRSTGFYRNKAKSLQNAARAIVDDHDGQVPRTMDGLTDLPGVARKTANVVLGNAFDKSEGVVVDTHVARLSRRLAFTEHRDAKKVEKDLMALYPRKKWTMLAHLLIFHGRQTCRARKPDCENCPVLKQCPQVGLETG